MNKLTLDFADNPELKTALDGKEPGQRVTLEVEVMVVDNNDQKFEGDIENVSVDDDEGETTTVEPDADSPVMIVMGPKSESKRKKSAKEDDEDDEA